MGRYAPQHNYTLTRIQHRLLHSNGITERYDLTRVWYCVQCRREALNDCRRKDHVIEEALLVLPKHYTP